MANAAIAYSHVPVRGGVAGSAVAAAAAAGVIGGGGAPDCQGGILLVLNTIVVAAAAAAVHQAGRSVVVRQPVSVLAAGSVVAAAVGVRLLPLARPWLQRRG